MIGCWQYEKEKGRSYVHIMILNASILLFKNRLLPNLDMHHLSLSVQTL